MQAAAVVVAAGRGTRHGGDAPKQYQYIGAQSVLSHSLATIAAHSRISQVVVVLHPDDRALFEEHVLVPNSVAVILVDGGASRDQSVAAGLAAIDALIHPRVLIHDAARPCLPAPVIDRVLDALEDAQGAAPALAVTDALWRASGPNVAGTQDRTGLYRAQTPQGFHTDAIQRAHAAAHPGAADDVEVARAYGIDVRIVEGDEDNIKITTPGDIARADDILQRQKGSGMDVRTGNGFDVHKFGPGDTVVLCGIAVPHTAGLVGHSDADVAMHAITDAIYGALADGDIGQHFPPSDPQWKGAASDIFLKHAVARATARGYRISNVDCTLICETPKIGPHAGAMRARLADVIGMEDERISVKATTSERLGFTGREEGIAALASVTLVAS